MEQAERVAFEEQQEAYLQGMFDAFQILQGTGVIRASEKVENLIRRIENDSFNSQNGSFLLACPIDGVFAEHRQFYIILHFNNKYFISVPYPILYCHLLRGLQRQHVIQIIDACRIGLKDEAKTDKQEGCCFYQGICNHRRKC